MIIFIQPRQLGNFYRSSSNIYFESLWEKDPEQTNYNCHEQFDNQYCHVLSFMPNAEQLEINKPNLT